MPDGIVGVYESDKPAFKGVKIDHPKIVEYARNCFKMNKSIKDASSLTGMPEEVIYDLYHQFRTEANGGV